MCQGQQFPYTVNNRKGGPDTYNSPGVIEGICQELYCERAISSGSNIWPTCEITYYAELSQEHAGEEISQDLGKEAG